MGDVVVDMPPLPPNLEVEAPAPGKWTNYAVIDAVIATYGLALLFLLVAGALVYYNVREHKSWKQHWSRGPASKDVATNVTGSPVSSHDVAKPHTTADSHGAGVAKSRRR